MRIKGFTAVVSGGGSGMGRATAAALTEAGAAVVVLDLHVPDDRLGGVQYVAVDVTDGAAVRDALAAVVDENGATVRAAVACAGIAPAQRLLGRRGVHDFDLFARVVSVNLVGSFHLLAAAAEQMAKAERDDDLQRGVIVMTSSGSAFEGQIGQAAYAASKGGINSLVLPAARDLADVGIRVNAIAPGLMDTPMVSGFDRPVRESLERSVPFPARLGRADEFASLVLSIIANDYLNGEVVRMDGALRMTPR